MTFKLITGLLSLALFFGAFSTWILEASLVCALLGFLSGMLFWGGCSRTSTAGAAFGVD